MTTARSIALRRSMTLAAALATAAASCTLLNPLDHLQARLGEPQPDGATGQDGGGGAADGATGDADDAPGCGASRWAECGVSIVATPKQPGDALVTDFGFFFSDEATGEIYKTQCASAGCEPPTVRVSGEDTPSRLAFAADSLFWTTRTAVRRLRVVATPDASPSVETIDPIEGSTRITAKYPHVVWTDSKGARGWPLNGSVMTLWSKPAASPSVGFEGPLFVSEGQVKACKWDVVGTNCPSAATVDASAGAELVYWAPLFGNGLLTPLQGIVAGIAQDGGTRLVVLDHVDEAGAPFVLSDEVDAVRAIAASGPYLYWTNAAGQLRRRPKDASTVTIVLRGLSGDATLSANDALLFIADRGNKQVLLYAP